MKNIFIITYIAFFCFACSNKYVFDQYYSTKTCNNGWNYYDTLYFSFNITDTSRYCSAFLNIFHDDDYKYNNLYLFLRLIEPDSTITIDTLQFILSSPTGKLLGNGFGKCKEAKYILSENVKFAKQGTYSLAVTQGMRDNIIWGIDKIGYVITKK